MMMMDHLSDQLLFRLLAFVPPSDLLRSACYVSKRWAGFATKYPLVLLHRLDIKPFGDPYVSHRVYTWKRTVVRVYRLPLPLLSGPPQRSEQDDEEDNENESTPPQGFPCTFSMQEGRLPNGVENDGLRMGPPAPHDQVTIDAVLRNQVPVYESDEFDIPPFSDDVFAFSFPPSTTRRGQEKQQRQPANVGGVIGNVLVIDLIGKNREQIHDQGFYACVERIRAVGVPLLEHRSHAQFLSCMGHNAFETQRQSLFDHQTGSSLFNMPA